MTDRRTRRIKTVVLALVAFAFIYPAAHVGIGGTTTETTIGLGVLLPTGLLFAYAAVQTHRRSGSTA
jgi:hypothetical protein